MDIEYMEDPNLGHLDRLVDDVIELEENFFFSRNGFNESKVSDSFDTAYRTHLSNCASI